MTHTVSRNAVNRRDFLISSAALTFALVITADSALAADAGSGVAINVWVSIGGDGTITIVSPAAEMGQGSYTAIPLVLAEELDADWSKVQLIRPPQWDPKLFGNPEYGGGFSTTSSFAVRGYFNSMRIAGAQARRVLLDAAAAEWNVLVGELTTEPSVVVHAASGKRLSYGQIATFAKVPPELPKIEPTDLKSPARFKLIGTDIPRVDVPSKVNGTAIYAIDVQVPDMVYAAIMQPPYDDGVLPNVDFTLVRSMPGVAEVVRLPDPFGVAVVGATVEQTQAAKNRVAVNWGDTQRSRYDSEQSLNDFAVVARDKSLPGVASINVGDVQAAMQSAARVISADYRTRYLYHAQMEPLSTVASVSADGMSVEIWSGTQNPSNLLTEVSRALGIDPGNVKFHQHLLGGGFGRRSQHEVAIQAALVSRAVKKPVKVVWSREDDVTFGKFRPMTAHHIEAGLDSNGSIVAWHHRVVAESVGAYTAAGRGLPPPAQDIVGMKGTQLPQYGIPNKRAEHVVQPRNARISSWRGVGNGINGFVVESFLDEIAKATGRDPIELRLELSAGQPRVQSVLRAVAEMADWKRVRQGRGLGVAFTNKDDTLCAGVVEVSLERGSGLLKIHNLWLVVDAGIPVQPSNLAAQTEGSAIYAIGSVLRERIIIKGGRVQQSNFDSYEVGRMSDAPNVEVKILSTDNNPTGGGESATPLVACAVGNAVAALTGTRLRELPFGAEYVRGALGA